MLFNSIDFALFLPIVFFIYWFGFGRNLKAQNVFLAISSYVFYGWWDYRFLGLIFFSTLLDYTLGLKMAQTQEKMKRKIFLLISVFVNIGLLGFFKYYNFFLENFIESFTLFGGEFSASRLDIILPVGISFYTFQTLSYTIDVYRGKINPTSNFIGFCAFVSFFPQLVAGPIERASHLLPQFFKHRKFEYIKAVDGMRQILWGLFKKMVIADNCATIVNQIFENPSNQAGTMLIAGAVLFAFQIYGDFSGYSDIAIGTARLFGFDLMKNFAFPYFSRDIAEFWRRWHISLSTWFRDYLYIPLGGSRVSKLKIIRNTFIIFIVSGFWHGANWTFIAWGALNALFFLPLLLLKRNRKFTDDISPNKRFPKTSELLGILFTFTLTCFAWIFFRADSLSTAFDYIYYIFININIKPFLSPHIWLALALLLLIMVEWFGRNTEHALAKISTLKSQWKRYGVYLAIGLVILIFGGSQQEFIYFQF